MGKGFHVTHVLNSTNGQCEIDVWEHSVMRGNVEFKSSDEIVTVINHLQGLLRQVIEVESKQPVKPSFTDQVQMLQSEFQAVFLQSLKPGKPDPNALKALQVLHKNIEGLLDAFDA